MGKHARDGPGQSRMLGGKRASTVKKPAAAHSLIGSFAASYFFQSVRNHCGVQRRLSAQETRLAQMVVVRELAKDISPSYCAKKRKSSEFRNCVAAIQKAGAAGRLPGEPAISCHQASRKSGKG